ncbi:hypothetical protein [Sphaerochaeta globosa]|uniref:Uncharacterized protein n=1 Tax=Sphaerochaeta globosa (strain ATCC BAA-1886 / DSM 22777 / Buddy) TaxID=158189 RepID=F0RY85_SPHGB|nr:hypothetical protein [Sphaerochaeta globosa]ADY12584.1 hypothetical protein SpiBuddy_0757 [Sphaerochaeta globosa str. Buddy]
MPQLAKGGKFIFGWSRITESLSIQLPSMAVDEYAITSEGKVYLFSGSNSTGGFCVTKKSLLLTSQIRNILDDTPALCKYLLPEGELVRFKGRQYCWVTISKDGILHVSSELLHGLGLSINDRLLAIRSSNIAFTMGVTGRLIAMANAYEGYIEEF